jgi:hypothetical protein
MHLAVTDADTAAADPLAPISQPAPQDDHATAGSLCIVRRRGRGNCGIYVPNILRADKRKEGLAKAFSIRAGPGAPMGYSHRSIGTARSPHDAGSSPQDTARSGDKAPAPARNSVAQKGGERALELACTAAPVPDRVGGISARDGEATD